MPRAARLRIAAWATAALLAAAALLRAGSLLLGGPGLLLAAALLAALAILALDALWPRVNLFAPAVASLPRRGGEGMVALTFDDGPVPPWTGQVLDVLARQGVKATFFCIGENVRRHPELARAIVEGGHTIGGHTATHRSLLLAGPATVRRELEGGREAIRLATGVSPLLFRCPKGYKSPVVAREARRLGLTLAGYSYPVWDVENPPAEVLVERVLGRVRAGDIIVMHDGFAPARPGDRDGLVEALPRIIEGMRSRGLRPVSLGEALRSAEGSPPGISAITS